MERKSTLFLIVAVTAIANHTYSSPVRRSPVSNITNDTTPTSPTATTATSGATYSRFSEASIASTHAIKTVEPPMTTTVETSDSSATTTEQTKNPDSQSSAINITHLTKNGSVKVTIEVTDRSVIRGTFYYWERTHMSSTTHKGVLNFVSQKAVVQLTNLTHNACHVICVVTASENLDMRCAELPPSEPLSPPGGLVSDTWKVPVAVLVTFLATSAVFMTVILLLRSRRYKNTWLNRMFFAGHGSPRKRGSDFDTPIYGITGPNSKSGVSIKAGSHSPDVSYVNRACSDTFKTETALDGGNDSLSGKNKADDYYYEPSGNIRDESDETYLYADFSNIKRQTGGRSGDVQHLSAKMTPPPPCEQSASNDYALYDDSHRVGPTDGAPPIEDIVKTNGGNLYANFWRSSMADAAYKIDTPVGEEEANEYALYDDSHRMNVKATLGDEANIYAIYDDSHRRAPPSSDESDNHRADGDVDSGIYGAHSDFVRNSQDESSASTPDGKSTFAPTNDEQTEQTDEIYLNLYNN